MLYVRDKTKGFVVKPTRLPVQSTQGKQIARSPRIVRKVLPCLKERVRGGGFMPEKQLTRYVCFRKGVKGANTMALHGPSTTTPLASSSFSRSAAALKGGEKSPGISQS